MLARFVLGAVTAGAVMAPALAGQMNADEARKFVAGKVFAFTCFDGTRGAGRISTTWAPRARCSSAAPVRCVTCGCPAIRFRSAARPSARRSRAFRSSPASISTRQTSAASAARSRAWASPIAISVIRARAQMLMARAVARPRSLRAPEQSADASRAEVSARVETPRGRERQIEPVKSEAGEIGRALRNCAARPS